MGYFARLVVTMLTFIGITVFLPQLPSKHQDRKLALKEAEAKLDARLVEQDRYFANPENKAKWEKERQDNLVNERFCW